MTRVSHSYNSVGTTIIAMTSIICGTLPPRRPYYSDDEIYSSLRCFSDLLREAGYHQVFMGAARKDFSGKDVFLEQHGYDEIYGDEDWSQLSRLRNHRRSTWGIHDTDLLAEAVRKLEELKEGPPFNLTILTINSHRPGYISPDCPAYEPGNRYLNGIHCTDFALGGFFRELDRLALWESTVIVLVGDHMVIPSKPTIRDLAPGRRGEKGRLGWGEKLRNATLRDLGEGVASHAYGRVFMAIHSPLRDLPPELDDVNHSPDVAPTVLELMGFELAVPFVFGKSILGERRWLSHLVGPETEIFEGVSYPREHGVPTAARFCRGDRLAQARIRRANGLFEPCARIRMVTEVDQWLRADEETGRPPHPPIPGFSR